MTRRQWITVDVAMLPHPVLGIGDPVPDPILVATVPAKLATRLVEQLFVGGLGYVLGRSVAKQRSYAERLADARMEEERLRIARDMHDIVTHTMSVVAVQAELGRTAPPRSTRPTCCSRPSRGRAGKRSATYGGCSNPTPTSGHITRLLAKLRARDRAQLVIAAYESGLVRPGTTRSV